nr:PREDICTED: transcription factor Dp-1 isoform X1 [Bemisia tabaci]
MTQQAGTVQFVFTGASGSKLVTVPVLKPYMKKTVLKPSDANKVQATILQGSPQMIAQEPSMTVVSPSKNNFISPILDHSGSRKRNEVENRYYPEPKRRRSDKGGKGLRHFSMKVCEKVRKKGTTSYNEVADELVNEFATSALMNASAEQQYDQKNIRRRVYDALNVLMAMNIISKEKKEIRWLGLPTNSIQECINLVQEKQERCDRIKHKIQQLKDLILQQISFKKLVERNSEAERLYGVPAPNSAIQLPFIIINTSKKTVIDCSISNDKTEYLFVFDDKFEIHDDIEVLKRMGLVMGLDKGECSIDDLQKAKSMVPKSLEKYVLQMATGDTDPVLAEICNASSSAEEQALLNSMRSNDEGDTSMPISPSLQEFSDDESDVHFEDLSSDLDVN